MPLALRSLAAHAPPSQPEPSLERGAPLLPRRASSARTYCADWSTPVMTPMACGDVELCMSIMPARMDTSSTRLRSPWGSGTARGWPYAYSSRHERAPLAPTRVHTSRRARPYVRATTRSTSISRGMRAPMANCTATSGSSMATRPRGRAASAMGRPSTSSMDRRTDRRSRTSSRSPSGAPAASRARRRLAETDMSTSCMGMPGSSRRPSSTSPSSRPLRPVATAAAASAPEMRGSSRKGGTPVALATERERASRSTSVSPWSTSDAKRPRGSKMRPAAASRATSCTSWPSMTTLPGVAR
mmetsp:Transcript_22850/g.61961  ORF Transcript_22850/g.61961 Transcript_22850/m.61961 type:complete len:300 (+) Transcript_22850:2726-3625(+)